MCRAAALSLGISVFFSLTHINTHTTCMQMHVQTCGLFSLSHIEHTHTHTQHACRCTHKHAYTHILPWRERARNICNKKARNVHPHMERGQETYAARRGRTYILTWRERAFRDVQQERTSLHAERGQATYAPRTYILTCRERARTVCTKNVHFHMQREGKKHMQQEGTRRTSPS
jgi:hypothetical protein